MVKSRPALPMAQVTMAIGSHEEPIGKMLVEPLNKVHHMARIAVQ
jgi:hypothetical protein